jgi:hypothetical protein
MGDKAAIRAKIDRKAILVGHLARGVISDIIAIFFVGKLLDMVGAFP